MYTGREWDETLNLYHYRARLYDSISGRFLGRDPIGFGGSRYGLYEWVSARALSAIDPSGLQAVAPPVTSPIPAAPGINPGQLPPGIGGNGPIQFPKKVPPRVLPRVAPNILPKVGGKWGFKKVCTKGIPIDGQVLQINDCRRASQHVGQKYTKPVCINIWYWLRNSNRQRPRPVPGPKGDGDEDDEECRPCEETEGPLPGPETDYDHDHGGCLERTGSMTHWHYFTYDQNPVTCKCRRSRRFGGCGEAPR